MHIYAYIYIHISVPSLSCRTLFLKGASVSHTHTPIPSNPPVSLITCPLKRPLVPRAMSEGGVGGGLLGFWQLVSVEVLLALGGDIAELHVVQHVPSRYLFLPAYFCIFLHISAYKFRIQIFCIFLDTNRYLFLHAYLGSFDTHFKDLGTCFYVPISGYKLPGVCFPRAFL